MEIAPALAMAFLAGPWTARGLVERGCRTLGREPDQCPLLLALLVMDVLRAFRRKPPGWIPELEAWLARHRLMAGSSARPLLSVSPRAEMDRYLESLKRRPSADHLRRLVLRRLPSLGRTRVHAPTPGKPNELWPAHAIVVLVTAFRESPWRKNALIEAACRALGLTEGGYQWCLPGLVDGLFFDFGEKRPSPASLEAWLVLETDLAEPATEEWPAVKALVPAGPAMIEVRGPPANFDIRKLVWEKDLAEPLRLTEPELAWFADRCGMNVRSDHEALHHYRYRWVAKRSGGYRLIEAPKPRLKRIQRWLLRHVLAPIPPSDAAHGFVTGRSPKTFAAALAGHDVVVRLDLEDFFTSITWPRVAAIYSRVGYDWGMVATLAGLCTTRVPEVVLAQLPHDGSPHRRFAQIQRLRMRHLPQGASTSPALSNLVAWRLDQRLGAMAKACGAVMVRYADDIAFAGGRGFGRMIGRILPDLEEIVRLEGFRVNRDKVRIMWRSERQLACGLVVNSHPAVARREYDNLRALLFNATRTGLARQNRDDLPNFAEHLRGRISWVESVQPERGRRLMKLFARIPDLEAPVAAPSEPSPEEDR